MNIRHGKGKTQFGPGVSVDLTGDEVATAINAYLVAHNVYVFGPRTITVNGELCGKGHIYVDPSGQVNDNREDQDVVSWSGRGTKKFRDIE